MSGNEFISRMKNIENLDNSDLKEEFNKLKAFWIVDSTKGFDLIKMYCDALGLDINNLTIGSVENKFSKVLYEITIIHMMFVKNDILDDEIDDFSDYMFEFNKIFQVIYYLKETLHNFSITQISLDPNRDNELNTEIGISRFTPIDTLSINAYQTLLLFLLKRLYDKGFMRYGQFCYSRIYNEKGEFTYAWEQNIDIEKFIYLQTQKESQFDQWKNLTNDKGNFKAVVNYLESCSDPQFRDLEKNRNIFSFRNGVYVCKRSNSLEDYFYKYGDIPQLPPDTVACKYFDVDFKNFTGVHWYDIPTPSVQRILDYQFKNNKEYNEICKWVYILIGRLLYNAGELDDWQVMPFIKGVAGSGKSSLLTKVIQHFYDPNDVAVIANEIEKTFGLAGFSKKYIFIAPEIKKNFGLSQASLQSIISAEEMSIPVKHKMAETLKWSLPGIMVGNELPDYQDSSGSISRRLVIIEFKRPVKKSESDPKLEDKLKTEVPIIIKKCNKAYLEAVELYGNKNIWNSLPKFFSDSKDKLKEDTNTMQHFLCSGKIRFGGDCYCTEKDFKAHFNKHCIENNFPKCRFNNELYELPFYEFGEENNVEIVIDSRKRKYPKADGSSKVRKFIFGLEIIEENEDEDDED